MGNSSGVISAQRGFRLPQIVTICFILDGEQNSIDIRISSRLAQRHGDIICTA